ncbi:hypothetical protein E1B28_013762 [Marasmius oreades]|uniref:AB hydrolase-1 domain-containing protein n=1 Tax=Marasmius oreades TaxID=181124 RepID=A0A9P7RRN7_9AGAR|nr:uncharacterized protein E1B28_013762 [Marasmius oreades]KAG7087823.1 hypothetical protein E1B28_013762 [Marasmius oreades]
MFTHHTYTLSDNIQIFFTDSGPPPDSDDYTTLVILHGSGFNGFGFEKFHIVAHSLNLRTVIWNRRGYPGSTPYTDLELGDLKQGRKIFMERIGRQLGEFLKQFIKKENIPKATRDRTAGGIALMGWSMGNSSIMALFSDPKLVPHKTYLKLEPYVKDLVLYEPPSLCFAYPLPQDVETYTPLTDPELKTPDALYESFVHWVTSFYDHQDLKSADVFSMGTLTKRSSDATVTKWTHEEFERYTNKDAFMRTELPMFVEPMQTTLKEVSERTLYNERLVRTYFPDLKLTLVVGTKAAWLCAWTVLEVQSIHDARVARGAATRPTKTYKIMGGNHFAHWEVPKTMLEKVCEGMSRDS